jgi:hypothetical protein
MRHDREEQSAKKSNVVTEPNKRRVIEDELGNVKQYSPTVIYKMASGLTRKIEDLFNKYAEGITRITSQDVFSIDVIHEGSDVNSNSPLACDTIVLSMRTGKQMTACCILVYTTASNLVPRTFELRHDYYGIDEDIELPAVPSEIFDSTFKKYVSKVLSEKSTVEDLTIQFASPKILYKSWEIHQAESVFGEVANNLALTHGVLTTRDVVDSSLNDAAEEDYMLDIKVTNVESQRKVYDESGLLIMPTLESNISYCKRSNSKRNSGSYNNPNDSNSLMKLYYRASYIYGEGELEEFSESGRYGDSITIERRCFIPLLTIEQQEDVKPTLGRQLLGVMSSIKVLDSNRWATIVERPEILAYLNIRCNLDGKKDPAPLDKEDVAERLDDAIDGMIYPDPLMAMISRKGTAQANLFETWINDPAAVVEAADRLTDGEFSHHLGDDIFEPPVYEARLAGTYTLNNEIRTLAEIDIVQLLTQHPDKTDLHQLWIESQSTTNFRESVALKIYVLNKCVLDYEILDIHNIIYVPEPVIDALTRCLEESDIKVVTNTWQAKRSNDNWSPHRALARTNYGKGRDNRRRRGRGHRR